MNNAGSPTAQFPKRFLNLHWHLKTMAQLQVFIGLVCLALGGLADYGSISAGGLRPMGITEVCGAYFIATGLVGIMGSTSYRRGLMVAFLVMAIHSMLLFAPAMIGSGVAGMILTNNDCWIKNEKGSFG